MAAAISTECFKTGRRKAAAAAGAEDDGAGEGADGGSEKGDACRSFRASQILKTSEVCADLADLSRQSQTQSLWKVLTTLP